MTERPTAQELTEAIQEFLGGEILPTLTDHRLRFRMLVAMNALSIVYRELAALPVEDDAEQRELARDASAPATFRPDARAGQGRRRGAVANRLAALPRGLREAAAD